MNEATCLQIVQSSVDLVNEEETSKHEAFEAMWVNNVRDKRGSKAKRALIFENFDFARNAEFAVPITG